MKSLMYHYVRESSLQNSYSRHKDINEFKDECKVLKSNFEFIDFKIAQNNFEEYKNALILTFDDGLKDHLNVAEILSQLNLKAVFYISTGPYMNNEILPVHKSHIIVNKVGPEALDLLFKICEKENLKKTDFIQTCEEQKFSKVYTNHNDNFKIKEFKRIINYCGKLDLKKFLLDRILKELDLSINIEDYYLTIDEILYIQSLGFEIGSHGINHDLLSRLSRQKQEIELLESKKFLEKIINKKVTSFCYPYGSDLSFNNDTINILSKSGYKNALKVKSVDINEIDFIKNKYELPRYDCNKIRSIFKDINFS